MKSTSLFRQPFTKKFSPHTFDKVNHFSAFPALNLTFYFQCCQSREVDYIFDLDDEMLSGLTLFAKKVSHAVKKAIPCKRIGVAVIGLEVPHTHIHLVPMNNMGDINFTKPKLSPSKEELAQIAEQIRKEF